jgi:hypothetical protein
MSKDKNKDLNNDSSSSSSSVGPARLGSGINPIFNQPRLLLAFNDSRTEQKMETLDLSIGIRSQKRFVNIGRLDLKGCKVKSKKK